MNATQVLPGPALPKAECDPADSLAMDADLTESQGLIPLIAGKDPAKHIQSFLRKQESSRRV